jgi:hypothetical protein
VAPYAAAGGRPRLRRPSIRTVFVVLGPRSFGDGAARRPHAHRDRRSGSLDRSGPHAGVPRPERRTRRARGGLSREMLAGPLDAPASSARTTPRDPRRDRRTGLLPSDGLAAVDDRESMISASPSERRSDVFRGGRRVLLRDRHRLGLLGAARRRRWPSRCGRPCSRPPRRPNRGEQAHWPIDHALSDGVVDGEGNAGGGDVPHLLDIEVEALGQAGRDRHRGDHRLVRLVGNDEVDTVEQRSGAALGVAGDWSVEIASRVSEFDEYRARVEVPVR